MWRAPLASHPNPLDYSVQWWEVSQSCCLSRTCFLELLGEELRSSRCVGSACRRAPLCAQCCASEPPGLETPQCCCLKASAIFSAGWERGLHCKSSPCLALCSAVSHIMGCWGRRWVSQCQASICERNHFFALDARNGWVLSKAEMRIKGQSMPISCTAQVIFYQSMLHHFPLFEVAQLSLPGTVFEWFRF